MQHVDIPKFTSVILFCTGMLFFALFARLLKEKPNSLLFHKFVERKLFNFEGDSSIESSIKDVITFQIM